MKKLSEIKKSSDPYDINSKERLKKNLERKFKKLFGTALYLFETQMRLELEANPELHKDYKNELFKVGNKLIQNMKKELDCYNITYVPFTMEMKGSEETDNG